MNKKANKKEETRAYIITDEGVKVMITKEINKNSRLKKDDR